jgi:hypothetical protein
MIQKLSMDHSVHLSNREMSHSLSNQIIFIAHVSSQSLNEAIKKWRTWKHAEMRRLKPMNGSFQLTNIQVTMEDNRLLCLECK